MIIRLAHLPLLIAGALAQLTSSEHYDRICFDLDGKTEGIIPGYTVHYKCGAYGNHDGNRVAALTPQDCAMLCRDTTGCAGSSWLSVQKRCVLSGELKSGDRPNTLYMKKVDPPGGNEDPFPVDYEKVIEECRKGQQDCTEQLDRCNSQFSKCEAQNLVDQQQPSERLLECQAQQLKQQEQANTQLGECKEQDLRHQQECAGQLGKCKTESLQAQQDAALQLGQFKEQCFHEKQQLSTELAQVKEEYLQHKQNSAAELAQCEEQALKDNQQCTDKIKECEQSRSWGRNAQCPDYDNKVVPIEGKGFKFWCHTRSAYAGTLLDTYRGTVTSIGQCAEKCALNARCNHAQYVPGKKECTIWNGLSGSIDRHRRPSYAWGDFYDSAVLVTSPAGCQHV